MRERTPNWKTIYYVYDNLVDKNLKFTGSEKDAEEFKDKNGGLIAYNMVLNSNPFEDE